jgi:hypothetical protein
MGATKLRLTRRRLPALLTGALCGCWAAIACSEPPAGATQTSATAKAPHDGQHDFDFLIGSWNIHLKRRLRPLTGSNDWVEFDGKVVCRTVWNGHAETEEFIVDSPAQNLHIQGLATRLYNPKSGQWSIYWADSKNGSMDASPQIGQFKGGRGEFYGVDSYNGRAVYVRFVWTNITSAAPHFEQSYSDDGGKTWEVNWITEQTRVPDDGRR